MQPRWGMALGHQYPLPEGAQALQQHIAYAKAMLHAGYYADVFGKAEEVRGFIREAEEYLAGRPRKRGAT